MTLTREEETQIRQSVRQGLERLRQPDPEHVASADTDAADARLTEAERIMADETERYYTELGMVKHTTRSGRLVWLNRTEVQNRGRRRQHGKRRLKIDRKVVLVWAVAILVAALLAAYLIHTETLSLVGPE